jgi:Asp-tRNA(Asn)/Glu-tRNA(Gln) amidotransferase B subunit
MKDTSRDFNSFFDDDEEMVVEIHENVNESVHKQIMDYTHKILHYFFDKYNISDDFVKVVSSVEEYTTF